MGALALGLLGQGTKAVEDSLMRLWNSIRKLAGWQQLIIVTMVLVIVTTWLAVCLILASYL
jgi:hypothetical protein